MPSKLSSLILTTAIVCATVAFGCRGTEGRDVSGLTEASTNLDLESVKAFLERVSAHIDGFGKAQIDPLVSEIASLAIESENSWDFEVVYQGAPLHIRAFMDDFEAPDMYFPTTPALAETITQEMHAYFDELGY